MREVTTSITDLAILPPAMWYGWYLTLPSFHQVILHQVIVPGDIVPGEWHCTLPSFHQVCGVWYVWYVVCGMCDIAPGDIVPCHPSTRWGPQQVCFLLPRSARRGFSPQKLNRANPATINCNILTLVTLFWIRCHFALPCRGLLLQKFYCTQILHIVPHLLAQSMS